MSRYPFIRKGLSFVPSHQRSEDALRSVKEGDELLLTFKSARSIQQLKLYWSIIGFIIEHTNMFDNKNKASTALKIACGLVDTYIDAKTGEVFYVVRSIAIESMAQNDFNEFFDQACREITERWMPPGTELDSVRAHIMEMTQ